MRFVWWITTATNTHLEYVILIAFSLQQYLREDALMLHCVRFHSCWDLALLYKTDILLLSFAAREICEQFATVNGHIGIICNRHVGSCIKVLYSVHTVEIGQSWPNTYCCLSTAVKGKLFRNYQHVYCNTNCSYLKKIRSYTYLQ
jgi:hypothetical protein